MQLYVHFLVYWALLISGGGNAGIAGGGGGWSRDSYVFLVFLWQSCAGFPCWGVMRGGLCIWGGLGVGCGSVWGVVIACMGGNEFSLGGLTVSYRSQIMIGSLHGWPGGGEEQRLKIIVFLLLMATLFPLLN